MVELIYFGCDLVRAIMEGIAFGVRQNIQVYLNDGWQVGDIRVLGGISKNSLWNQITADVTNRTVLVPPASAGAPLGGALLVGLATGIFPSIEDAVAVCPAPKATYLPNPAAAARYDQLYPIYEGLYAALSNTFRELAAFRRSAAEGKV